MRCPTFSGDRASGYSALSGFKVGVVIPNLLNWPDSVVVLDIKRENFQATAGFRAAHGQAVHLFVDDVDGVGTSAPLRRRPGA